MVKPSVAMAANVARGCRHCGFPVVAGLIETIIVSLLKA
jgi:hypothetical protein